jgi:hypothetical protein
MSASYVLQDAVNRTPFKTLIVSGFYDRKIPFKTSGGYVSE